MKCKMPAGSRVSLPCAVDGFMWPSSWRTWLQATDGKPFSVIHSGNLPWLKDCTEGMILSILLGKSGV